MFETTLHKELRERLEMEKITRYKHIPKFTNEGVYHADMSPAWLIKWIQEEETNVGLDINPNFQRGHVWTREQQIAYVEYRLRGGKSGVDLYFNCPFWLDGKRGPTSYQDYVCVDGLQRITAWDAFFKDEIPVFGSFASEFTDKFPILCTMRVHVNNLKTEEEVLQWYIDMNAGGTPHSKEEIHRVEKLLEQAKEQ